MQTEEALKSAYMRPFLHSFQKHFYNNIMFVLALIVTTNISNGFCICYILIANQIHSF